MKKDICIRNQVEDLQRVAHFVEEIGEVSMLFPKGLMPLLN